MQNRVNQIQFWTLNRQLKPTCATCYRVKSSFIHLTLFLCNSLFNKKAAGTRYGQFSGSVKKIKDKAHLASLQVLVYNTVVLTTYLNISYHIFILSVIFFSFSFQFISLRNLFRTFHCLGDQSSTPRDLRSKRLRSSLFCRSSCRSSCCSCPIILRSIGVSNRT